MDPLPILLGIEKAFFQCSVCLDTLSSPLMLPCYHPYCKVCLKSVIESSETSLICPICQKHSVMPENGIESFSPNLRLEYTFQSIQIHKSFIREEIGQCVDCEQMKPIVSYCYYCKCFLCAECYQMHLTSKMFLDHRQHVINLKNDDAKDETLQKLAILSEGHKCESHRQINTSMMCHGCGGIPICNHRRPATTRRIQRETNHKEEVSNTLTKSGRRTRNRLPEKRIKNENDTKRVDEEIEIRLRFLEQTDRDFDEQKRAVQEKHDEIEKKLMSQMNEMVSNDGLYISTFEDKVKGADLLAMTGRSIESAEKLILS